MIINITGHSGHGHEENPDSNPATLVYSSQTRWQDSFHIGDVCF
jgi:hypothetical protein